MVWTKEAYKSYRKKARDFLIFVAIISLLILALGVSCAPTLNSHLAVEKALSEGTPKAADLLVE